MAFSCFSYVFHMFSYGFPMIFLCLSVVFQPRHVPIEPQEVDVMISHAWAENALDFCRTLERSVDANECRDLESRLRAPKLAFKCLQMPLNALKAF